MQVAKTIDYSTYIIVQHNNIKYNISFGAYNEFTYSPHIMII